MLLQVAGFRGKVRKASGVGQVMGFFVMDGCVYVSILLKVEGLHFLFGDCKKEAK